MLRVRVVCRVLVVLGRVAAQELLRMRRSVGERVWRSWHVAARNRRRTRNRGRERARIIPSATLSRETDPRPPATAEPGSTAQAATDAGAVVEAGAHAPSLNKEGWLWVRALGDLNGGAVTRPPSPSTVLPAKWSRRYDVAALSVVLQSFRPTPVLTYGAGTPLALPQVVCRGWARRACHCSLGIGA